MELNFTDPRLFTHGVSMQSTEFTLLSLDAVEEVAAYVAPEVMGLTSFRIAEEPSTETTAGVPFLGARTFELTQPLPCR